MEEGRADSWRVGPLLLACRGTRTFFFRPPSGPLYLSLSFSFAFSLSLSFILHGCVRRRWAWFERPTGIGTRRVSRCLLIQIHAFGKPPRRVPCLSLCLGSLLGSFPIDRKLKLAVAEAVDGATQQQVPGDDGARRPDAVYDRPWDGCFWGCFFLRTPGLSCFVQLALLKERGEKKASHDMA